LELVDHNPLQLYSLFEPTDRLLPLCELSLAFLDKAVKLLLFCVLDVYFRPDLLVLGLDFTEALLKGKLCGFKLFRLQF
jgi:hypothetical protein